MAVKTLYHMPVTQWVMGTVERVLHTGREDSDTWNTCWANEYAALGGIKSSGDKPCPRAAAYGLWILGRLRSGKRPLLAWNTAKVYCNLNKNAAYASITADLLATDPLRSATELWPLVQAEFTHCTGDAPAGKDQGEVRLVVALFHSQQLVVQPVRAKT